MGNQFNKTELMNTISRIAFAAMLASAALGRDLIAEHADAARELAEGENFEERAVEDKDGFGRKGLISAACNLHSHLGQVRINQEVGETTASVAAMISQRIGGTSVPKLREYKL